MLLSYDLPGKHWRYRSDYRHYPWSPNLCSVAIVDGVYKTRIVIQCSCLIFPLCGSMNRYCEEPGYSFQSLEGRSLINYYAALFDVDTYTFS